MGHYANHLFNKDVPPQGIWNECYAEIARARSTMKEGNFAEAGKAILRARAALLEATGIFYRWRDGIQGAGTKMQVTIGVVAVALIFAAVAATVASAGAAGGGAAAAAQGTSATATVDGVTSLVTKADALLAEVATSSSGGIPRHPQ